ncbi:hypothetical protein R3P38DRAFT_185197 [Favolaschia claudopus]|uniref:Uncharacterized protein n=1 Tax=Favolaschia claudopus TaxID=2862362 RepID=A0AAW0D325_9AGAR
MQLLFCSLGLGTAASKLMTMLYGKRFLVMNGDPNDFEQMPVVFLALIGFCLEMGVRFIWFGSNTVLCQGQRRLLSAIIISVLNDEGGM